MKKAIWGFIEADMRLHGGAEGLLKHLAEHGIDTYLGYPYRFYPEDQELAYESKLSRNTRVNALRELADAAKDSPVRLQPWWVPKSRDILLEDETVESLDRFTYRPAADDPGEKAGRLCMTWPHVRRRAVWILKDIIEAGGPNLSGIHMDVIRYSDNVRRGEPCQCEACREMYQRQTGLPTITSQDLSDNPGVLYKYMQFRHRCVRELVDEVVAIAKQAGLSLSMAARANYHRTALFEGQDWVQWAREGLVDFIASMNYATDFEAHRSITQLNETLMRGAAAEHYAGIGRKFRAGEISEADFARQVDTVKQSGAAGVCVYRLDALTDADWKVLAQA